MAAIGFIGLGHMGLPMAINLIKAGHQVIGYDLQADALEQFRHAGGQSAVSLQEVVLGNDIIITMLQTGQQVQSVCLGDNGIYAMAKQNALHIDCSSIDVESSKYLHQQAGAYGLMTLDAPVSGGVAGAAAASLTFMVGGDERLLDDAKPILSAMGKKIFHTGSAGSGQAAKICNNMILGISMVAISEAFVLAKKAGLAADKLFEVVNNSSGQCWAMSQYAPVPGLLPNAPASHAYRPGFAASMMLKDLLVSQRTAAELHAKTPMGALATAIYQGFNEAGFGDLDFSAIINAVE